MRQTRNSYLRDTPKLLDVRDTENDSMPQTAMKGSTAKRTLSNRKRLAAVFISRLADSYRLERSP